MPELNVIAMLSNMMGEASSVMGWVAHFVLGTLVWGGLFALLAPHLPGRTYWLKGVAFGVVAWVLMMVIAMPMAGAGLFGMALGVMAPMMTLILHVVFGAVLGGVYGALHPQASAINPAAPHS